MKINASLAKSLLWVSLFGLALPMQAKPPAEQAPASQDETTKVAEPVIPGVVAARKNGGYIGIELADGGYKISFYDNDKKQVSCDVDRATARWNPSYKKGDERRVLILSDDGKTLISNPPMIRPPYNFKLFISLLSAEGEVVESFPAIDFRA